MSIVISAIITAAIVYIAGLVALYRIGQERENNLCQETLQSNFTKAKSGKE